MNLRSRLLNRGNSIPARSLTAQLTAGVLLLVQGLMLVPAASAETLARGQGRCKLTSQSGGQTFTVFDGHCMAKQKQQGRTTIFVLELDNGSEYRFSGPNTQALQVETSEGIHNAQFVDSGDRGVFSWQDDGDNYRLSMKLDTRHNPNVSHDDPNPSLGTALGALAGAVIGGLISGSNSSTSATQPPAGTPVDRLSDLIGARAGQAENTLTQRGYRFVKSDTDGNAVYSQWLEGRTNYCVTIRTMNGRYQSIVYAGGPFDCQD